MLGCDETWPRERVREGGIRRRKTNKATQLSQRERERETRTASKIGEGGEVRKKAESISPVSHATGVIRSP